MPTELASQPEWVQRNHVASAIIVLVIAMVVGGALVVAADSRFNLGLLIFGMVLLLAGAVLLTLAAPRALEELSFLRRNFRWWHGIWLLLIFSSFTWRIIDVGTAASGGGLDAASLVRVVCVGFAASCLLVVLALRRARWLRMCFSGSQKYLTIFGLICLVSTAWSVNAPWTAYKSFEYLTDMAVVALLRVSLRKTGDYKFLLDFTLFLFGLLLLSAWIGAFINPSQGFFSLGGTGSRDLVLPIRLEGQYPGLDADGMGEMCAIILLISAYRFSRASAGLERNKLWYGAIIILSFGTFVICQARTALVGFIFGCLILFTFAKDKRRLLGWFLVGVILLAIPLVAFASGPIVRYFLRGEHVESLQHLTGRTEMWKVAWAESLQRPFTGYGGFAGRRFVVQAQVVYFATASSLLSAWVDALIDIGFIGPILLLLLFVGIARSLIVSLRKRGQRIQDRNLAIELTLAMAVIFVRSFVTGSMVGHFYFWLFTCLAGAEFLRSQPSEFSPRFYPDRFANGTAGERDSAPERTQFPGDAPA